MSIVNKIKKSLTYSVIRPVVYNEELLQAYSTTSVTGGTIKGKTALVTGATSGIGYATSQRLLNEGCNVIITGRNEDKLKSSVNSLCHSDESSVSYIVIDQLNTKSVENGVQKAFNHGRIDLWVNCAGIFKKTDRDRKFRGLDSNTYFEVVNTNLKSTVLATRLVAEEMIKRGIYGEIINVASICGLTNHFGYTPYGISKTATIEYTRLLADEYKGKVLIVGIAPGSVATRMGDKHFGGNIAGTNAATKHVAMPEEIASTIAFISSPIGRYLNGQTILASAMETV